MKARLRILLLTLVGLLLAAGTPAILAYEYMEHDPGFCASCHVMSDAVGRWSRSEHSKIECHACHASETKDNLRRLYYAVVEPRTKIETHAAVDRAVCQKCHEAKGGKRWQDILATAGHKKHMERRAAQCIDCHATSVHKVTPPANVCVQCHKQVSLHETKMVELECLDCHDFLAAPSTGKSLLPRAADCRRCHGEGAETADPDREETIAKTSSTATNFARRATAPRISLTGMHGGLDCKRCHNPHAATLEEMRSGRDCTRCHRGDVAAVRTRGPEKHRDCSSCHRAHAETGSATKRCVNCHSGYLTGTTPTTHGGKCSTCHRPHNFKLDRRICSSCHAERATKLWDEGPKEHDACTNCHSPHAPPPKSEACMKCHAKQRAHVLTARPERHRECISCHDSHAGRPKGDARCRTCHEKQAGTLAAALAEQRITKPEHGLCRSCHRTMHGTPERGPISCASCHAKQASVVQSGGTPEPHQICSSCHDQHGGARPDTERCVHCHEKKIPLGAPTDPHKAQCTRCHQPHGRPGPDRAACKSCHSKIEPVPGRGADQHRNCRSCHAPHEPAPREGGACHRCHQKQLDSLVAWQAQVEHQKCTSCHIGHDAGHPKPCITCHEKPGATFAAGKHSACKDCHRPHQTQVVERKGWWKECARCHAKQADGARQRGATHSFCGNCHQTHAFARPACDSCHQAIRSQLMHRVKSHQKCSDCHETHASTGQVRRQCLACHEKQRADHFPEAQRCDACHAFSNKSLGAIPPEMQKRLEDRAASKPDGGSSDAAGRDP